MQSRCWHWFGMALLLVCMGTGLIVVDSRPVGGNLSQQVFYEDFGALDPAIWDVFEFGSPNFSYSVGSWMSGESWVYAANMSSGGMDPPYNGFHFVHPFAVPLEGAFVIAAEMGWSAASYFPASQTALRLMDASDDILDDQGWSIQVQCRDYWAASSCQQVAHIESDQYLGTSLPLEGKARLYIMRDEVYLVQIYWDDTLLGSGTNYDTITSICLRIVGRYDYPGASGGFNYVFVQGQPPLTPLPVLPAWVITLLIFDVVIIILLVIIIVFLATLRRSEFGGA